jgi:hypothetical protein
MCPILASLLLVSTSSTLPAGQAGDGGGTLKRDANLPGIFLPFNATGPYRGRFHCLISDYGLEPTLMLFVQDTETPDFFNDLLKQIDARLDANPAARLHAFVVFVTDNKTDLVTDNDKREQLARKVEDLANGLMLKHVVLAIDTPRDLEKYGLGEQWGLAILYRKYRILNVQPLTKDGRGEADKLLAEIDLLLKAAKKK